MVETLDLIKSEQKINKNAGKQEILIGLLPKHTTSRTGSTRKLATAKGKQAATSPAEIQAATPVGKKKKR